MGAAAGEPGAGFFAAGGLRRRCVWNLNLNIFDFVRYFTTPIRSSPRRPPAASSRGSSRGSLQGLRGGSSSSGIRGRTRRRWCSGSRRSGDRSCWRGCSSSRGGARSDVWMVWVGAIYGSNGKKQGTRIYIDITLFVVHFRTLFNLCTTYVHNTVDSGPNAARCPHALLPLKRLLFVCSRSTNQVGRQRLLAAMSRHHYFPAVFPLFSQSFPGV